MEGWELFEKVGYRAEMAVTVYKSGHLALTKAVWNAIGAEYVELLYNRDINKIGIRPSNKESPNAHMLKSPPRLTSKLVNASAFLVRYQLDSLRGEKYPAAEENGMVIIDINKPMK